MEHTEHGERLKALELWELNEDEDEDLNQLFEKDFADDDVAQQHDDFTEIVDPTKFHAFAERSIIGSAPGGGG